MNFEASVGQKAGPYQDQTDPQVVKNFAHAVGFSEFNEVPPTFATRWRKGEFELMGKLGVELKNVLHAEQEYEAYGPIPLGVTVEYETVLSKVFEKSGGNGILTFLVFETIAKNLSDEEKLMLCRSSIVLREQS